MSVALSTEKDRSISSVFCVIVTEESPLTIDLIGKSVPDLAFATCAPAPVFEVVLLSPVAVEFIVIVFASETKLISVPAVKDLSSRSMPFF